MKIKLALFLLGQNFNVNIVECLLSSNLKEFIGIVGVVFLFLILFNSLIFYWLFGYSNFISLFSNLSVALEITIFYWYLLPRKVKFSEKI